MFYVELVLIAVAGLVVGSFLNVLIYRAKEEKLSTALLGRSYCPACKHVLAWFDLFPLFSYISLGGKCRYCGNKISLQYPIVELINALVYLILFFFFGFSLQFVFYAIIFSLLIVVAVYDMLTQFTPEIFVWIALAFVVLGDWYLGRLTLSSALLGVLIGAGVPGVLVAVSRERWMGSGDIKIGLILGLLLGYPGAVLGMFLSFLLGAISGLVFIKMKNKTMRDSLPFAPFLILGTFIALLYGERIISWYLGTFAYSLGGV